jgi:hypothetical protein
VLHLREHAMDYRTAFIASRRTTWFDICCQSLKSQINDNCVLYLDGPVSDKNISQNLQTYKKNFPQGEVVNLQFENYQPLLAWVFLDNFKNPKSELLLLVEDDLVFSHIEQLRILYDNTKENEDVIAWSCWSRHSIRWPLKKLYDERKRIVRQHNHIGSMINLATLKDIGQEHFKWYLQEYNNKGWSNLAKSSVRYMRNNLNYNHPSARCGIDGFYTKGIINNAGKLRVSTVYNKLVHMGVGGRDDTHGNVQKFYDHWCYNINYIEDLIEDFEPLDVGSVK